MDLVTVHRCAELQTIQSNRAGEYIGYPRSIVVVVPGVPTPADGVAASISHAKAVIQPRSSGRNGSLRQKPHEVDGNERASDAHHIRPVNRRLQPRAVMVRRIPVAHWRVVSPKRNLEIIVVVI